MVYKPKRGMERAIFGQQTEKKRREKFFLVGAPKPLFQLECLSEKERVSEKEEESCARRKGRRGSRTETEKEKESLSDGKFSFFLPIPFVG